MSIRTAETPKTITPTIPTQNILSDTFPRRESRNSPITKWNFPKSARAAIEEKISTPMGKTIKEDLRRTRFTSLIRISFNSFGTLAYMSHLLGVAHLFRLNIKQFHFDFHRPERRKTPPMNRARPLRRDRRQMLRRPVTL